MVKTATFMLYQGKYEICEFYYFRHPTLKPGFQEATGTLITGADVKYPEAWDYLQSDEGQVLCTTEADWQAMNTATWATLADGTKVGWDGVGGAPYYVVDTAVKTIRLPDLRGMYPESAGFDGLTVGGVHGDGIRNIVGAIEIGESTWVAPFQGAAGCFVGQQQGIRSYIAPSSTYTGNVRSRASFNAINVVPTANKNQPRAYGVLACVYLGR